MSDWPSWSMTTWSARPSASSSRWVHITTVRPSAVISRMSSSTAWRRLGVEARRGLVEEQQVGLVEDRAGQGQAGLHAGGVAADLLVEGALMPKRAAAARDAVACRLAPAEAVELGGVGQVVLAGEPVVERRLGRHDAAAAADLLAVDRGVEAEDAHRRRRRGRGRR